MTDQSNPAERPAPAAQPESSQPEWSAAQQYPFRPQPGQGVQPVGPGAPLFGSYVQDGPFTQPAPYAADDGQGGYVHRGYPQAGYPQANYPQANYPQAKDPQAGSPQAGYQPSGYYQPAQYGPPAQYGYPQGYFPAAGQLPPGQPPYRGYPTGPDFWSPPPPARKSRSHRLLYGSIAGAVAAALAVGSIALAVDHANNGSSQQTSLTAPNQQSPLTGNGGNGLGNNGFGGLGGSGTGSGGNGSGGAGSTGTTGSATSAQQVGIVDINSTINFGQGKAAGTGLVLSSNGEILTNNHVVQDSTTVSVTVVSTGKTYSATVVGTDPTDDVAVIQLKDASGLATAKLGDSAKVAVGTAVTAVGNAGGTGGTPTAATGTVSALDQSITASDDNGSNAERLTGMIEVNANIQPGDSGGALYENAGGTIVGMNTAASSSSGRFGNTAATTGFAIPIAKATDIADKIESGTRTSTIHIGYPAFLGVQLAQSQTGSGASIGGVIRGTAAASAGLAEGDTITAVDGKAIASPSALSAVAASHRPGDQVRVTYTDTSGQSQTVTLTLGQGPAD